MATDVTIAGDVFRRRSPWGAWGLGLITFGIYYFVWHYKVNDEARRYLDDQSIRPGLAVLAVLFGGILLYIPAIVSIYRTGDRIKRMQERAGFERGMSPALGLVAALFFALNVPYMQGHMNTVWDTASSGAQVR